MVLRSRTQASVYLARQIRQAAPDDESGIERGKLLEVELPNELEYQGKDKEAEEEVRRNSTARKRLARRKLVDKVEVAGKDDRWYRYSNVEGSRESKDDTKVS